jgi:hypothetical protein
LKLKENMRVLLSKDPDTNGFDNFTLMLGNGSMETVENTDLVETPADMCLNIELNTSIHKEGEKNSMTNLADHVYPNIISNFKKASWMEGQAVLAPTS